MSATACPPAVFTAARRAALARAEAQAKANPGEVFTRVAVTSDLPCGFEVTSRYMYEEACSESEWIGQATAIFEDGKVDSTFEA